MKAYILEVQLIGLKNTTYAKTRRPTLLYLWHSCSSVSSGYAELSCCKLPSEDYFHALGQHPVASDNGPACSSLRQGLKAAILYLWGLIGPLIPFIDLATDIRVLQGLWPVKKAWGFWVILGFIVLPYMVSGLYVLRSAPPFQHEVG
jgi:hypothetical protein